MGVRTFFLFKNQCHASFRQGWYCFDSALEEIDCDTGDDFFLAAYFNWQAGPGLIGLGVATFAKILDLLCNIIVPTPTITRSPEEQAEYERLVEPTNNETSSKEEKGESSDHEEQSVEA